MLFGYRKMLSQSSKDVGLKKESEVLFPSLLLFPRLLLYHRGLTRVASLDHVWFSHLWKGCQPPRADNWAGVGVLVEESARFNSPLGKIFCSLRMLVLLSELV